MQELSAPKFLIFLPYNGLNDLFCAIAKTIYFCEENCFDTKNIFISTFYKNLNLYFDIKNLQFLETINIDEINFNIYDVICNKGRGSIFPEVFLHINKYFKLKQKLQNKFDRIKKKYLNCICLHFRFYDTERKLMSIEEEFAAYKAKFLNIYSKDEKYVIFSDMKLSKKQFKEFKFKNITFYCNGDYQSSKNTQKQSLRSDALEQTLEELYIMSFCKLVYKTKGHFTNLVNLFNSKQQIKNLI